MMRKTGDRLISAVEKQTKKIIYFCSAEKISPNVAVHEIRKSYKRLRALLYFFAESNPTKSEELCKEIKEAGKILSPIRESFVNIQYFDKISSGNDLIAERKIRQVKEILLEKNRILIDDEFVMKNLVADIVEFIKQFQLQIIALKTSSPSIIQFKSQLSLSFSQAHEIYQDIEPELSPLKLHQLRKNLKQLWYQFDFLKFMHPRYFKMKSVQLNKITEQLGDDHDLYVFQEDLKAGEIDFTSEELLILDNQVQHQRELNMVKLLPRLKQFFSESPELFDQKLDEIFKLNNT